MLVLIVLHGEFSLFTVRAATFGTKFIKIRDKKFSANSWRLLHRLYCPRIIQGRNPFSHPKENLNFGFDFKDINNTSGNGKVTNFAQYRLRLQ